MIDEKVIDLCAANCDSFYLYDESRILDSIRTLKESFPQIEFLYSIKCNPNPHVLNCVFSQQFGADAASAGEVVLAQNAGLKAEQIFYSAPGKSIQDIENTIDHAIIIADSIGEIKRIQTVAGSLGKNVKIGIRINPNFSFDGEKAKPSKFGIDEDQAFEFIQSNTCSNVKIVGLHVHLKSQVLNKEALAAYYRKNIELAERFAQEIGEPEYINMGSGMGIQYAPTDEALDLPTLGDAVRKELDAFRVRYPHTRMIIEVGRYAVCKSGIYVTRVMDRKISCGKTYLILKNTLNGFIRPSLAKLIEGYSSEKSPAGAEPLFTSKDAFEMLPMKKVGRIEIVTLVGNLCTATDVIAEDIELPYLECGDLIVITNAGSYAAVLSPMQFSTQENPQEFFAVASGKVLKNN